MDPNFTLAQHREELAKLLLCTSLSETAVPGTGLPGRINQSKVSHFLKGPVILELVHMTDVGVSALGLERVRQTRERRMFLDKVARTPSQEGQALRELEWLRPKFDKYPRKRLKLFLSDGFLELQAIELEPLPFELGETAMGVKVGICYLSARIFTDCTVW